MLRLFFFIFLAFLHISVFAQDSEDFEGDAEIFGPTRVNGTVGNGALSVGISQWGEITVLRYPSPSFWDQLDYKTKEGERSRRLKYFGALENQGGFIFVYDGSNMISLRDLDIQNIKQYYKSQDSGVLVTEYYVDKDTKVYVYDFVYPVSDIFVRRIKIETAKDSDFYVVHFLNLAPTTIKVPKLPLEDWQDDTRNDFAAFTTDDGISVQFVPFSKDRDFLRSEYEKIKGYTYDQLLKYSSEMTGIFLAFKFFGTKGDWSYVGFDQRCGDGRTIPSVISASAFSRILNKDIFVSDRSYSLCSADAFSAVKACSQGGCEDVFFVLSAGKTLDSALSNIRSLSYEKVQLFESQTDLFWQSNVKILESQKFFGYLNQAEKELCKRALISLIQATDRETKATVASISTQPPYAEDWPRDGAYFNLFLGLSGFSDLAEERNIFYEKVQSKEQEGEIPAGTWRMNFYADGMIGGPWDFEIDQVGFVLWSWANHLNFTKNKIEFVRKIYDALKLSSYEVLINCKDDRGTGLQCLAHEDDQVYSSITMVGSGTVYAGIRAAMKIAKIIGDTKLYKDLEARKIELENAIFKNYADPSSGFIFVPDDPHQGMSYVLFPADLPMSDDWVENYGRSAIRVLYYNFYEAKYLIYEAKWIMSVIVAAERLKKRRFQVYQEFRGEAEKFLRILVEEVPTSTKHMGEVVRVFVDENGRYRYENRIAMPHIWEATLTCLTSIALRYPESLKYMGIDSLDQKQEDVASGCQCRSFSTESLLLLLLILTVYFIMMRFTGRYKNFNRV